MANFVQAFFDDFADSSLGLLTDLGNGSFAETSFLRATCPVSTNCEWWTGLNNAPVAYEKVYNYAPAAKVYRVTARLFAFAASGNNIFPGMVVWQDRENAYQMGFDNTATNVAVNRKLAGTSVTLQNTTGLSSPNTTAHQYRVYWNKSNDAFIVPEDGFRLIPNQIAWYRSVDDGATFVRVHDRALEFNIDRFGVFGHTYGALPSLDADFDWLELEYAENFNSESETAATEDSGGLNPPGDDRGGRDFLVGPKDHQLGFSTGLLVPGPADQPVGTIGPFDISATEDAEARGEQVGDADHAASFYAGLLASAARNRMLNPVAGASDSPEDTVAKLGAVPAYTDLTTDTDFNAHFTEKQINGAFYYDTTGEDWADPTNKNLTGYARDGTRYTAGVQDAGPVNAPWATEAFSVTRGNRNDFPEQALIVWTPNSITIFDLTNFPTSLTMWMRFLMGDVSNYYMASRGANTIKDVRMINGVMHIAQVTTPYERGRFILINFKGDTTTNTGHLIGSDDHWRWNGDITQRNTNGIWLTSGVSPEVRIDSEDSYSTAAYKNSGVDKVWYAISGEDDFRVIEVVDGIPQYDYQPAQRPGKPANIGDIRKVTFDDRGWLWFSEQNRLMRNVYGYQGGAMISETRADPAQRQGAHAYHRFVELPEEITDIVAVRNYVYCATDKGIYRVHRGSLQYELYFTVSGGGGTKEILTGDNPVIDWLEGFSFLNSSYLSVASKQGVTLIRLFDDFVVRGITHPDLDEPGANFNTSSWS